MIDQGKWQDGRWTSVLYVFYKRLKTSNIVEKRIYSGVEGEQWKENEIQAQRE